ncbi:MAG TPA: DedA family protein, partial [Chloroflexota bacterium]|nr:DedA family protein [Chloroflexota bacterium]
MAAHSLPVLSGLWNSAPAWLPGWLLSWAAWAAEHESLILFLVIFCEESGVPMPIPADVLMAMAGHRVAQGHMSVLEAFLIGQSATLLGSSILYWVARRAGRPLLFRYSRWLRLHPERLAQVEQQLVRRGALAVILGRLTPGLRIVTPLACGVFRVPYGVFVPAMAAGSSLYIAFFLALGLWGGPAVIGMLNLGSLPMRFVVASALLVLAALWLRRLGRRASRVAGVDRLRASARRTLEAALLAGVGAIALMGLVIAWLLALFGLLGQTTPEEAMLSFLAEARFVLPAFWAGSESVQELALAGMLVMVPLLVVSHLALALLYAFLFEHRLWGHPAMRGLQFALLPWLVSMLVVMPLAGTGPFGLRLGTGIIPAAGE